MFSFERVVESIIKIRKDMELSIRGSFDVFTSKICVSEEPPFILGKEVIGTCDEILKADLRKTTPNPYILDKPDDEIETHFEKDQRERSLIIRVRDDSKEHNKVSVKRRL